MSARYPIFLDLEHRRALIVGGGALALQKLRTLEPTGASLTVVAPEMRREWPAPDALPNVRFVHRAFVPGDLEGAAIVFAATDDAELNHRIVAEARRSGILANAVDDPVWCDFYTPAVVRRGKVTLAISTDGGFPGISRVVREVLDEWLPVGDDALVDALFALRADLRASRISPALRADALRKLVADFKAAYLTPAHSTSAPPLTATQRSPAAALSPTRTEQHR